MVFVPEILSFFSCPPPGQKGHLYYLEEEEEKLRCLFEDCEKYLRPKFASDIGLDAQKISKAILQRRASYTIIHYSGHADSFSLNLPAEQVKADNFIEFLKTCSALKLLVLNGCSTQGFVKRVLAVTTVEAVIASPRPINDKTAMMFSCSFYDHLLQDTTIEQAFTTALSLALKQKFTPNANIFKLDFQSDKITGMHLLSEKDNSGNKRHVTLAGGNVMKDNAGTSWGLYVRDEQMLDWKFFTSGEEDINQEQKINTQIKEVRNKIFGLHLKKEKLFEDIGKLKKKNDDNSLDEIIEGREKEYAAIEEDIEDREQDLVQLKGMSINQSLATNDDKAISIYSDSFKRLNFSKQKDFVGEAFDEGSIEKIAGFVLHGTSQCCLNQLLRNVVRWAGVTAIDEKVIFDYNSVHQEETMWEKVRQDLHLNVAGDDPVKLVKEIQLKFRDEDGRTCKNIAFLFRNDEKDIFSNTAMTTKIFEFWETIITLFNEADKDYSTFDHRVFLFLVDDRCTLLPEGGNLISSKENSYKQTVSQRFAANIVNIIPTVEPVKVKEIMRWQTDNDIPGPYRYTRQDLDKIMEQTRGYMLPTIKEISSLKIKTEARKERAFQSFLTSINNPL